MKKQLTQIDFCKNLFFENRELAGWRKMHDFPGSSSTIIFILNGIRHDLRTIIKNREKSDTNGPFAGFAVEFYTICDQNPCGRRLMPPHALLLVNYDEKQHT